MDWISVVNAIVVAVVPVVVYGVRLVVPKLPRIVVWALPMIFGSLLALVGESLAVPGLDPWRGLLLGACALVLRELVSTVKEHGING